MLPYLDELSEHCIVVHCRADLSLVAQVYRWGLVAHWASPGGRWWRVHVGVG